MVSGARKRWGERSHSWNWSDAFCYQICALDTSSLNQLSYPFTSQHCNPTDISKLILRKASVKPVTDVTDHPRLANIWTFHLCHINQHEEAGLKPRQNERHSCQWLAKWHFKVAERSYNLHLFINLMHYLLLDDVVPKYGFNTTLPLMGGGVCVRKIYLTSLYFI